MPSLVSIPEGEVVATPSHQSSFNPKDSEKTNSKAQSSSESQKTRTTARSKLMEEAKRIGEDLRALRLDFDSTNNRFSENVAKEIKTPSTHGNSCLLTYTIVLVGCPNQEVI